MIIFHYSIFDALPWQPASDAELLQQHKPAPTLTRLISARELGQTLVPVDIIFLSC